MTLRQGPKDPVLPTLMYVPKNFSGQINWSVLYTVKKFANQISQSNAYASNPDFFILL